MGLNPNKTTDHRELHYSSSGNRIVYTNSEPDEAANTDDKQQVITSSWSGNILLLRLDHIILELLYSLAGPHVLPELRGLLISY